MAVAAYASVLSLLRVIDNIQHPSRIRLFPDPKQIDALREKLCSLMEFFEVHSSTVTEDIEFTARKIPRIAYDAEILLLDGCVENRSNRELEDLQNDVGRGNFESFRDEMHLLIVEFESVSEALLKTAKTIQFAQEVPARVHLGKFTAEKPLKIKMVGFDDQLSQVLEKLISNRQNLVIVPIVGMAGIGKTTLARSLFAHPYNLHHFQERIWLTISQDYSVKRVLRGLLRDGVLGEKEGSDGDESESELITKLHQKLFGQRYLIVLDDVWSLEAWCDLRRGFPDCGRGSRVVVTTRLSDIANSLDSSNISHSMKFLNEDTSWDLFSEKAFERGGFSPELEEIGRQISKCCNGLPLLLVLIGGLLANSKKTVGCWQTVGENISSFANSMNDEYCLRILSLSYHHLPIHLKLCFLYTRHFEEDSNVGVSQLIKTWVSHGIVKPISGKSLEGAARKYLEDLIGRNMLLIRERSRRSGNVKICGIHDLLRDLSIRESNKEQFLELPRAVSMENYDGEDTEAMCAVCNERKSDITTTLDYKLPRSMFDTSIKVCSSCESSFQEFAKSRFTTYAKHGSRNFPLLATCRSITLYTYSTSVFDTLPLIQNLEFIDIGLYEVVLPKEIWEMPQLRNVKAWSFTLPDPANDLLVLKKLQTLTRIQQFKFTEDIVKRAPNLRKLVLYYYIEEEEGRRSFHLQNIARLQKLESLSIECDMLSVDFNVVSLPRSLKKLTLGACRLSWEDMTIVGSSLPNLEVLRLRCDSVWGREWIPIEGEELFVNLRYFELDSLGLFRLKIDREAHFRALEKLVVMNMSFLALIPREFGDLPSLSSIHLERCDECIVDSARAIVEEQLSYMVMKGL